MRWATSVTELPPIPPGIVLEWLDDEPDLEPAPEPDLEPAPEPDDLNR